MNFTFEAVHEIAANISEYARNVPGEECGGLLFGDPGGTVKHGAPLANMARDRYQEWAAAPEAIAPTIARFEESGFKLLGSWHTHPYGDTYLSSADAQLNHAYAPLLLIVAAPLDHDRGRWDWKLHHCERGDSPLDLTILPPQHLRL